MKINQIKTARTIKANVDIDALGLKKEDVLSSIFATKTEKPNSDMNWFVYKEEKSSTGEGFSSYEVREINLNEEVIADFAQFFTLIDSFEVKEEPKTNSREYEFVDTDDLIVMYLNVLDELDRRMDEKIQAANNENNF